MAELNIEVEKRSFISSEEYDSLLSFFASNAKLINEDYQETFYFDCKEDLRIQRNNSFSKIWLKKGKIHDEQREEIEIKFPREDFEKLEKLFLSLGYNVQIKWFRKRTEFLWNDINVCLDYTKGYGHIIELEKMSSEDDKQTDLDRLNNLMATLKIKQTSRDEFEKKFAHYKNNWQMLIK